VGAFDGLHHPRPPPAALYGLKQVGYVEHRLEPDGRHESRLVHVPCVATLNITDFRSYGPI
jgi:Icc protein